MSDYVNEDRDQRNGASMEESNAMTVDFLRARLLSERSVSKSARQRADELAKRVSELEDQLKVVSLQRKKAEKATADVLAILENNGISDLSEELDSCSDQEGSPHEFRATNSSLMIAVTSNNMKSRTNEMDSCSSSEIESSPSKGRSLSWRSTKDFQHFLEKKKYMDSVKRRASFASNGVSARKVGKSCRRIRHREMRSTESQNDGTEKAACSMDVSDCSNSEFVALRQTSGYDSEKYKLESTTLGSSSETREMNSLHFNNVHEKGEDMESALQHQAQLIGQYEEEEKAQREWEEKFTENNNSSTQDSCDPSGNHSDVTEEQYVVKFPAANTSNSDNQETKPESVDDSHQTSKSLPSLADSADKKSLQDQKNYINIPNTPEPEFSFPMSNEKIDEDFLSKQYKPSEHRSQQFPLTALTTTHDSTKTPSSYAAKSTPPSSSPNRLELAVMPQEPSDNLGTVLEALQRAKLSLNQKLSLSSVSTNAETKNAERSQMPFVSPGLFRLPTDYQFENDTHSRLGFANSLPENTVGRFISDRNALSGNLFLTTPSYRPFNQELGPRVSAERSFSQPRLNEGSSSSMSNGTNILGPYTNTGLQPAKDSYPFLPDVTLRLPLNEEGSLRTISGSSGSERGLPSIMRFSSYDEHGGSTIYR